MAHTESLALMTPETKVNAGLATANIARGKALTESPFLECSGEASG
ncbi:MAG: hypothetical protein ACR2IV_05760 [Bryobacteraceae bacterium]